MTIKQLIKLEDKAKEVWVVSPSLHYDLDNKDFTELVSVNLGQHTKYKYIVPATKEINANLDAYKKKYNLKESDMASNFLVLPENDFLPFVMEIGIYNASSDCIACAAPALEDPSAVMQFSPKMSKTLAKQFKAIWKKYKRTNP
jgi:hypothetical protein